MEKRKIAPEEQFLLLSTIFCYPMLDFYIKTWIRFSPRDKWLFEITKVEITRVDCINRNREYVQTVAFDMKYFEISVSWIARVTVIRTFIVVCAQLLLQHALNVKINRIYDGVEAETRKSQASFQII